MLRGRSQPAPQSYLSRRVVLAGAAVLAPGWVASPRFEASVGVARSGAPSFDTIAAALAAAPPDTSPYRVLVGEGVHREKLVIERENVALEGAGSGAVISYDTAAGMIAPDGQAWGTWRCATLSVRAPGFSARNLTIENAFDYIADLAHPQFERVGSNGAQAVALMLGEGSDCALFEGVRVIGHQDTLFVNAGRTLFRDCFITGSVDFIFGAGAAFFDRCQLRSRYRPLMQRNHGWVAVPSTPRSRAFGLVFDRCRLTREAQVPPASVALGRPWRPARDFPDGHYGDPNAVGMAAYLRCWMDDHISADGWDEMSYAAREGSRVFLEPGDARFGEFASEGPGAFVNRRRPQLPSAVASAITQARVLQGWRG
jgi:pectinesterase